MASELQKEWEEKINRAKAIKKDWKEQFKVDLGVAYFEGRQRPNNVPEDEWITVNKIYSQIKAQLPSLYSIDPYFYVKLKKSFSPDAQSIQEFQRRGAVRQDLLNYFKGELDLKNKARLSIQDAFFSFGVSKSRHSSRLEKNPDKGKPLVGEDGKELLDDGGKPITEPDSIPVDEQFHLSRVHPDNLLFDEDAGPLEDSWGWIAENIKTTREQAEKDPRFKKKDIDKVKGQEPDNEKKTVLQKWLDLGKDEKKPEDIISYWEIYDLKKQKWLIVAEGAEDVLMEPDKLPPGVKDHPYELLMFTPRDKSPYPIPPVYPALDPQKEFNLSRSRLLTHRKRFNRKYEVIVPMLADEGEADKLITGDDGTLIKVQAHGAINPIKDAPLDQQTLIELGYLANDVVEAMGAHDAARGIASADSATEAGILEQRLDVREGDALSQVVDFVIGTAQKLDRLIVANMTKEMAIRITGPQGEIWTEVDPETDLEEINGEFEYTVNVGASTPRLPDIERAQWTAFISQVVIPMPHILTAPNFMKRMAEMFHIEDEAALEELRQIGLEIMSQKMPMPGNGGGSQPAEGNPAAAIMGMATGALGGNNNGGGSQV